MSKKTYWLGTLTDECQLCGLPFKGVMYDAALAGGPWANICDSCFYGLGCKLGTGYGQKYKLQKDKRWLKVGG